ncbi:isochorismatase family proteinfamily protein [Coccidioides immitis RMSCC 2394]|uniref:Isochorismatase family proteinfamily protein n=1 Tax=Coccidioides immitis RMSCC 2394 TaxID=404692 RepID=A0A0J6YFI5_COCIT|nr:isochorismatase family proteinfamily protein [Coccidioides immitis RMSCC 2394]
MLPPDFFQNIPQISTRRALLVLDLQNDFVSPDGALFVPNTPEFLARIPDLASHFRSSGKVIWVQTLFTRPRDIFSPAAGGDVALVSSDSSSDPEAFLAEHQQHANPCCLPDSAGAQFPPAILSAIDSRADTVLVKSDYSAFQSPNVLLSFRSQFITEIYICGALSNVSVYATALDAVRNGFTVTLVEDCLGFRRFSKHRDARRRMTELLGVYTVNSAELLREGEGEGEMGPLRPDLPAETTTTTTTKEGIAPSQTIEVDDAEPPSPLLSRALRRLRTDEDDDAHINVDQNQNQNQNQDRNPPRSYSHTTRARPARRQRTSAVPTLGPGDTIGSGDSKVIYDLPLPENSFRKLRDEVNWQKMYHMSGQVPRLVAVQGAVQSDGSIPIYRHPADESPPLLPFTATVDAIREIVEKHLGHPLNHVLIQLYRSGEDRISEHSDKTLDIVRGSSICNVSLGAQRVMTLRTKASATPRSESGDAGRQSQRVPLPHNSLFILGETSNMKWLHGIRQDKRPESTKGPEELAFNGERISLTFRHIGTFINPELDTIWGQGARSKTQDNAGKIIHGEASETERLIHAFGQENQQTVFDWDAHYGEGFDVVNFVTVTNSAKVVLTGDEVSNLQVLLCLVENGIRYDVLQSASDLPPSVRETLDPSPGDDVPIYLDSDDKTCISGSINILTHIGTHRRAQDTPDPSIPINDSGPQDRLERAGKLLDAWRTIVSRPPSPSTEDLLVSLEPLTPHLDFVASFLPAGQTYISAPITFGIDDCAFWPVLRSIALDDKGKMLLDRYSALVGYYWKVGRRACVKSVLEEMKARGYK